jgi:hypothetical protein
MIANLLILNSNYFIRRICIYFHWYLGQYNGNVKVMGGKTKTVLSRHIEWVDVNTPNLARYSMV